MKKALVFAAMLLATPALAAPVVSNAEIRAPMTGKDITAAYFTITNPDASGDALLSVTTPIAKSTELHGVKKHGEMLHMYEIKKVMIAGKNSVVFAPGGQHLMLYGVAPTVKAGDSVPLTLMFKKAGPVTVNATVVTRPTVPAH